MAGTGLGGHGYQFAISGGSLDLTVLPATAVAWNRATGGSWNTAANWLPATIPNTWYYTATFGNTIGSSTATVTLDSNPTVSGLTFSNTGTSSYIISRSGTDTASTLTLDNGVAPVTLSNTTASNTIAVPVVLNSNLVISSTTGTTLTISGPVRGAAALSFSGGGSLVLSGSNTYSGGTTISGGTLQLGDGASQSGSVAGNITDNAQLVFANPSAQTYAGAISGSGSVTKAAAGTLVLTGTNVYTGGTTVSGGTLDFAGPDRHAKRGHPDGERAGGYVVLGALFGALVARDRSDRDCGGDRRDRCDDLPGKRERHRGHGRRRGFARWHGVDHRGRSSGRRARAFCPCSSGRRRRRTARLCLPATKTDNVAACFLIRPFSIRYSDRSCKSSPLGASANIPAPDRRRARCADGN